MTMAVVAAPPGQYLFNIPGEAQRLPASPALDPEPHRGRPSPHASRQIGDALGQRPGAPPGRNRRHARIGEVPLAERGHVPLQPVAVPAHHQKLAGVARPFQLHRLGHDPDRQQLGAGSLSPERDRAGGNQDPQRENRSVSWLHLWITLPTPSPTNRRLPSRRPPGPGPRDGR